MRCRPPSRSSTRCCRNKSIAASDEACLRT
jgi:hypothetical protein